MTWYFDESSIGSPGPS